jgi:hypothetical protein
LKAIVAFCFIGNGIQKIINAVFGFDGFICGFSQLLIFIEDKSKKGKRLVVSGKWRVGEKASGKW